MDKVLTEIDNETSKVLSFMYKNQTVKMILLTLFGLYFVISPKLPNYVRLLYNNIIFRTLIILLIIYLSVHDHQLALMVTAVYLLTLNNLNNTTEHFGWSWPWGKKNKPKNESVIMSSRVANAAVGPVLVSNHAPNNNTTAS